MISADIAGNGINLCDFRVRIEGSLLTNLSGMLGVSAIACNCEAVLVHSKVHQIDSTGNVLQFMSMESTIINMNVTDCNFHNTTRDDFEGSLFSFHSYGTMINLHVDSCEFHDIKRVANVNNLFHFESCETQGITNTNMHITRCHFHNIRGMLGASYILPH